MHHHQSRLASWGYSTTLVAYLARSYLGTCFASDEGQVLSEANPWKTPHASLLSFP